MTVPSMAEDMLAFADALGIGRFDLMGWLTGGERAQDLAVGAPDRIRGLVPPPAPARLNGRREKP